MTGMKGRKANNLGANKIGSLPLLASGEFNLPNIIVKAKVPILGRPRIFLCAIKDLEHVAPYDSALDLMKPGNGDQLLVLHGYKDDESHSLKVRAYCRQELNLGNRLDPRHSP